MEYYQAKTINTNVEIQVNDTRNVYHVNGIAIEKIIIEALLIWYFHNE